MEPQKLQFLIKGALNRWKNRFRAFINFMVSVYKFNRNCIINIILNKDSTKTTLLYIRFLIESVIFE